MKPRRRHRATSFSMSMLLPLVVKPMTLRYPHRANLDSHRVAFQFGHQIEAIHLTRGPDVVIIPKPFQDGPSAADLQRTLQNTAVVFKAVPGQAGRVVEPHV